MEADVRILAANLFSIVCVVIAGEMAIHGMGGWGWFLLVGLCAVHVFSKDNDKEDDDT